MTRQPCRVVAWAVVFTIALIGAGCSTSSSLQVKAGAGLPAAPLELKTNTDGIRVAVTGLIVYNSPGAWKSGAYWDEYLVRVENQQAEAVEIDEFILSDFLEQSVACGTHPADLETSGRIKEKYVQNLSKTAAASGSSAAKTALGVAGATAYTAAVAAFYIPGIAPVAWGGALVYGGALAVGTAIPSLWAADKFAAKNREQVLAEFTRRRLALPLTLEPGASVTGSVFFPLTPGPLRLTAKGHSCESAWEVPLALPRLEGLHLKTAPDKSAREVATSNP